MRVIQVYYYLKIRKWSKIFQKQWYSHLYTGNQLNDAREKEMKFSKLQGDVTSHRHAKTTLNKASTGICNYYTDKYTYTEKHKRK